MTRLSIQQKHIDNLEAKTNEALKALKDAAAIHMPKVLSKLDRRQAVRTLRDEESWEALNEAIALYMPQEQLSQELLPQEPSRLRYGDTLKVKNKIVGRLRTSKELYEQATHAIQNLTGGNFMSWGRTTPYGKLLDKYILPCIIGGSATHLMMDAIEQERDLVIELNPHHSFERVKQVIDDKSGLRPYKTKILPLAIQLASANRLDLVVKALEYVRDNYPVPNPSPAVEAAHVRRRKVTFK